MAEDETTSATPELDKMSAVRNESQAIGEFVDWLGQQGMVIHKWTTGLTNWFPCMELGCDEGTNISLGTPCRRCGGAGGHEGEIDNRYLPISTPTEELLAEFFKIDLKQVDVERRALLGALTILKSEVDG